MQVEKDGLQARYVDAKDRFIRSKNKSKVIRAKHTKYERVIHELEGSTIFEVEIEALKVVQRCERCRDQSRPTSGECKEQVAELKRLTNLFKIIIDCQPDVKEWLDGYPDVAMTPLHYDRPLP